MNGKQQKGELNKDENEYISIAAGCRLLLRYTHSHTRTQSRICGKVPTGDHNLQNDIRSPLCYELWRHVLFAAEHRRHSARN